ncbi:MAG: cysteine desulfurase family protein [Rubricoccaceae bacterium]|nr:cysteine desulfurase family protein [Rubricoccaceae bacterium]
MQTVYLDNAATTPLDPEVLEAMRPFLTEHYGNPSSVHKLGRKAKVAIEEARERIADVLNCEGSEIVFTSGGTEADNAALHGVLMASKKDGLVTSPVEHEAVLRTAEALEKRGIPVSMVQPTGSGGIEMDSVREMLTDQTALLSLMVVNNETGIINPVRAIAEEAKELGITVHADAVQAAGFLPLDVEDLGVDLLSLSGHKIYGPKGVGVLFVRSGTPFQGIMTGGAQERRRRGGTENVAAIVGFAEALVRVMRARAEESKRLTRLQERLAGQIQAALGDKVQFNTPLNGLHSDPQPVAPHILNVSFPPFNGRKIDGEMLLLGLDVAGVYVSSGSACTSGAIEPSHVLLAMGVPPETANATVRFSLGKSTTEAGVDYAAEQLHTVVNRIRTG